MEKIQQRLLLLVKVRDDVNRRIPLLFFINVNVTSSLQIFLKGAWELFILNNGLHFFRPMTKDIREAWNNMLNYSWETQLLSVRVGNKCWDCFGQTILLESMRKIMRHRRIRKGKRRIWKGWIWVEEGRIEFSTCLSPLSQQAWFIKYKIYAKMGYNFVFKVD